MRRALLLPLLAALALAAGCNSRRGLPLDTRPYGGVDQGALLAWAWGGAAGFEDDDPQEIAVLFDPEPGDRNHRLMTCATGESECRNLRDFTDTGLEPELGEESFFGRFDTGVEKQDRLYLVVADRGARLATSGVLVATAASRPTRYAGSDIRFERGAQSLSWPRLPDSQLFVLTLTDAAGERPLTAIATRRKSWTYPELQGLVQYFHDPSRVGELRPGGRYVAVLYAINQQGWASVVSNAVIRP